jgi:hypothetical protein
MEKLNMNAKKKRVRISGDTLLEMFRFFTRLELFSFNFINKRMKRILELGDQKKQLRQRVVFPNIEFYFFGLNSWFFSLHFLRVFSSTQKRNSE